MSSFIGMICEENRIVVFGLWGGEYELTRDHWNQVCDAQSGGGAAKLAAAARVIFDEMIAVFGEAAIDVNALKLDINRNVVKQMLLYW